MVTLDINRGMWACPMLMWLLLGWKPTCNMLKVDHTTQIGYWLNQRTHNMDNMWLFIEGTVQISGLTLTKKLLLVLALAQRWSTKAGLPVYTVSVHRRWTLRNSYISMPENLKPLSLLQQCWQCSGKSDCGSDLDNDQFSSHINQIILTPHEIHSPLSRG